MVKETVKVKMKVKVKVNMKRRKRWMSWNELRDKLLWK
jgi:hypothetical protein